MRFLSGCEKSSARLLRTAEGRDGVRAGTTAEGETLYIDAGSFFEAIPDVRLAALKIRLRVDRGDRFKILGKSGTEQPQSAEAMLEGVLA